jgi:hypothetical protein
MMARRQEKQDKLEATKFDAEPGRNAALAEADAQQRSQQ